MPASPQVGKNLEKPSIIAQVFLQGKLVGHIRTHHYSEIHLPHKKTDFAIERGGGKPRNSDCPLDLAGRDLVLSPLGICIYPTGILLKSGTEVYPSDWGVSKRRVLIS